MMMIEKPEPLSQTIPPGTGHTLAKPLPTIASASKSSAETESPEEEPYTIKCICGYPQDDGNTIYCEDCLTWQHIGCFYPEYREEGLKADDFQHSCVDCNPRPLNRERAILRMRKFLEMDENDDDESRPMDKKTKRQMSKSSKKKPRSSELINGSAGHLDHMHARHGTDGSHHKKSKSTHKISTSISHTSKRSPSYGKPPSPASTPPDIAHDYDGSRFTNGLLSSYTDHGYDHVQTNSFLTMDVYNTMARWLQDPILLSEQTGRQYQEVFRPDSAKSLKRLNSVHVSQREVQSGPSVLRLKYFSTRSAIARNTPIIELVGQIGFQSVYCADPNNNWNLCTPLPFVFFHPKLPLCIDTRREGTESRYIRRSCKPNSTVETYLDRTIPDQSNYHFWIVSKRSIASNEQITLAWDFRFPPDQSERIMSLLGLNEDGRDSQSNLHISPDEAASHASWLSQVLAEYRGCACDSDSCAFKLFFQKYGASVGISDMQPASAPAKKKTSRKTKAMVASPISTAPHSDSRAPSEMLVDDATESDHQATPGVHSKASSRERSPTRPSTGLDTAGILTEPTDRDKRKVAMVEDTFRRMEQQPSKRKKRIASDDSQSPSVTKAVKSSSKSLGYVNIGTNSGKSPSPATVTSNSSARRSASRQASAVPGSRRASLVPSQALSRPVYVNSATQTDPGPDDLHIPSRPALRPARQVFSLAQRLLRSRPARMEEVSREMAADAARLAEADARVAAMKAAMRAESASTEVKMEDAPVDVKLPIKREGSAPVLNEDHIMTNAPSVDSKAEVSGLMAPPAKKVQLQVQVLDVTMTNAPAGPASASLSATQALPVTLTPIKKKRISLSDYTNSRSDKSHGAFSGASGSAAHKSTLTILEETTTTKEESPLA